MKAYEGMGSRSGRIAWFTRSVRKPVRLKQVAATNLCLQAGLKCYQKQWITNRIVSIFKKLKRNQSVEMERLLWNLFQFYICLISGSVPAVLTRWGPGKALFAF